MKILKKIFMKTKDHLARNIKYFNPRRAIKAIRTLEDIEVDPLEVITDKTGIPVNKIPVRKIEISLRKAMKEGKKLVSGKKRD